MPGVSDQSPRRTGHGGRHARRASPLARLLPALATAAVLALGTWGGLALGGPGTTTVANPGGTAASPGLTTAPIDPTAPSDPTAPPSPDPTVTSAPTSAVPTAPPTSTAPADPPAPPPAPPPAASGVEAYEQQVVALANEERAKKGCAALIVDSRLVAAARAHSADMATRGYFDHTTPEGVTFDQRISQAGFAWSSAAENIAAGQRDPAAVMRAWMNSDGHQRNILNCRLTHIGVGLAYSADNRPYWTQDFATPR